MTISEAIALVDRLKQNQYSELLKIKWLSKLDGLIYNEVFITHQDNSVESFDGYDDATAQ